MRFVVIMLLVAIVATLFSALWLMFADREAGGVRMARALSLRVGLSVLLFALLICGYYFGLIGPRLA